MENNQLQIIDESFEKGLIVTRNEREAIKGVRAMDAHPSSLRACIKTALAKCMIATGKDMATEDLTYLIDELKAEILRSYPSIRLTEIAKAIHKGSVGDFGIVYNLSLNTLVGFIRTYINSDARVTASKEFLMLDTSKPENKPSEEEIVAGRMQSCIDAFDKYKRNGFYNDYGNLIFNSLGSFNVLAFTDDQKDEIWKQSRKAVFNDLTKPSRSIDDRNEKAKMLEEVKANPKHKSFITEGMKIALNMFFKDLAEIDTDIQFLIQSKK